MYSIIVKKLLYVLLQYSNKYYCVHGRSQVTHLLFILVVNTIADMPVQTMGQLQNQSRESHFVRDLQLVQLENLLNIALKVVI